jgi:YD repeat-containing protein
MKMQVSTITDANNRVITVNYNTSQKQGRWVVSSLTLPNDQSVVYNYGAASDSELETIDHPDGTESTFSTTTSGTSIVRNFFDASAEPNHRKKTVYLSTNISVICTDEDGTLYYNQSSQLVWKVVNAEGELAYKTFPKVSVWRSIYEGGGKMKEIHSYKTQFYKTWNEDGSGYIAGTKESTHLNIPWSQRSAYKKARIAQVSLEDGRVMKYIHNGDNSVLAKIYPDATNELFEYNDFQQITHYMDRLGNITSNTYDAQGNLLEREVGLKFTGFESLQILAVAHFTLDVVATL